MIGAKPATKEALEEISLHDEIVFCEDLDEYRRYCSLRDEELYGKKPTMVIVDEVPDPVGEVLAAHLLAHPRIHVAALGGRTLGRSLSLPAIALAMAALESKPVASPTTYPIRAHRDHDMPVLTDGSRRRSKGERKGNKRYRWC